MQTEAPTESVVWNVVVECLGWLSGAIGVAFVFISFFPPRPAPQPIIDLIQPSPPVYEELLVGLVFIAAAAASLLYTRASRREAHTSLDTQPWHPVASQSDEVSAEFTAEFLRRNGIPARVAVNSPLPGLIESVSVTVPEEFLDQALHLVDERFRE